MKSIKKIIILLVTTLTFIGCGHKVNVFDEKEGVFKTIEEYIDEFGEPEKYDLVEIWMNEEVSRSDVYNPKKSLDEIISLNIKYNYYNKKYYDQTEYTVKGSRFYGKPKESQDFWSGKMKELIEPEVTRYSELNRDRYNRQMELEKNFLFNQTDIDLLGRNNSYDDDGDYPKIKYEYIFDLGESKYGKHFDDGDQPSNKKIHWFGIVKVDFENSIGFVTTYFEYDKITICQCLTDTEYSNSKSCKEKFWRRYGTNDPSTEQMEEDYYNCKNK